MYDLIALVSFLILFFLGVYLLYCGFGRVLNLVVAFWLFSASLWSLGQTFMFWSKDITGLYWSIGIAHLGVFMLGATSIHFALMYPVERKILKKRFMPYLIYIIPIVLYLFFLTNSYHGLFYEKLVYDSSWVLNFNKSFGLVGYISLFVAYGSVILGALLFSYSTFKVKGKKRTGSLLFLAGIIVGLISSIHGEYHVAPQSMFFPISGFLITYALLKYRMIDVTPSVFADKILDTMVDGLILTDNKGRIIRVNNSVENIFGFSEDEIKGKNVFSFFKKNDGFFKKFDFNKINGECVFKSIDDVVLKADDEEVFVSVNASTVTDKNDKVKGYVFSIRGITDKKTAELRLRRSKDELSKLNTELEARNCEVEQLLEQKNDFIDLLAHDIKNPLTMPLTMLPILRDKVDDEKQKEILDASYQSVKKIKSLIDDTLELSHLDDSYNGLNTQEVFLSDLVEKVFDENKNLLIEHGFEVEKNFDENLKILGDEFQVKEVFNNLISNAVKYTPDNKRGRICLDAFSDGEYVRFAVSDNGMGLDSECMKHVFDKFYKNGKPREGMDSTGLGLSLCKNIVEKHGGKIWAESPGPGKGCTFYFTLRKSNKKLEDDGVE
jgi:PAS domain S-box-containing protein